jgi:hypothetical protein
MGPDGKAWGGGEGAGPRRVNQGASTSTMG